MKRIFLFLMFILILNSLSTRVNNSINCKFIDMKGGKNPGFLVRRNDSTIVNTYTDSVKQKLINFYRHKGTSLFKSLSILNTLRVDSLSKIIPTRDGRLAFWINVFNAYSTRTVLNLCFQKADTSNINLPYSGIWQHDRFWEKKYTIGGSIFTLKQIKNKILRRFDEPNIHFSLLPFCCNKLKVAKGDSLEFRLDKAAARYISKTKNVELDTTNNTLYLSKIFDLYGEDFAKQAGSVVAYIKGYLPADQQAYLARKWNSDLELYEVKLVYSK